MPTHKKALAHLKNSDSVLAALIEAVGPCRLKPDRTQTAFEALVEAVCHQQLTGKAAQTILGRPPDLRRSWNFASYDVLMITM